MLTTLGEYRKRDVVKLRNVVTFKSVKIRLIRQFFVKE